MTMFSGMFSTSSLVPVDMDYYGKADKCPNAFI